MGIVMRRVAAIIPAAVLALTGCQSFSFIPGMTGGPSRPDSNANFLPNIGTSPLDGSGEGHANELPKRQKLSVCLAAARSMEKDGKLVEAIGYYTQVRDLDPRNELVYTRQLATLYDRKGDFDKALDEYQRLLKANPKDANAYNDLGYGYYSRGKFEAAEQNLRKSVELDPKNKRAWSNLGMTLAQLGKYDEGLSAFEKSVNKPQALCNIGFIQLGQGKWMEARDSYALALRLEPGLQKAQVALQKIGNENPRSNSRDRDRAEGLRRFREAEAARGPMFGAVGEAGAESGMLILGPERVLEAPTPREAAASNPGLPPLPLGPLPGSVSADADPLATAPPTLPAAPPPSVLSVD